MKWRQFKDNQNYQIAYRLDYISLQPLIRDLGNPETSKNYKYSNKFEFLKFCYFFLKKNIQDSEKRLVLKRESQLFFVKIREILSYPILF